MNDIIVEPQLGLRRRRRAIPDEGILNEDGLLLGEANQNNHRSNDEQLNEGNPFWALDDPELREPPHARRFRRLPPRDQPPIQPNRRPRPRRSSNVDGSRNHAGRSSNIRMMQLYCVISTVFAILAIVVTPGSLASGVVKSKGNTNVVAASIFSPPPLSSIEDVAKAAVAGMAAKHGGLSELDRSDILWAIHQWWNTVIQQQDAQKKEKSSSRETKSSSSGPFWWWRHNRQRDSGRSQFSTNGSGGSMSKKTGGNENVTAQMFRIVSTWIDPSRIVHLWTANPTEIIDNILVSIPRLLAIANFMLTITYVLHHAIASWFLDDHSSTTSGPSQITRVGGAGGGNPSAGDWSSPARERMGGFLLFKLLLISAVVAPDPLDLLILLSWYTSLSSLRSLDQLAHAKTTHLSSLGRPPRSGALNLLLLVLVCSISSAAFCVALFHTAGWGMVMLLICDCVTLVLDVVSHILKYSICFLEDKHNQNIQSLEARQLYLHTSMHFRATQHQGDAAFDGFGNVSPAVLEGVAHGEQETDSSSLEDERHRISPDEAREESRELDRRMESLELAYSRRLSILDNAIFVLDLLCHILIVAHFAHIWSLHGVQFTLVDAVLALHLHASVSSVCRKIARRINTNGIANDMENLFQNATDEELRKASVAGDVCCICLGTMSTGGHVKKLPCGHLYHTHCLREVVERAQSVEAARCPLCRSSLLHGHVHSDEAHNVRTPGTGTVQQQQQQEPPVVVVPPVGDIPPPQAAPADHSVIRFSTEDILPDWLPVPSFSFEVVRRASPVPSSVGTGTTPHATTVGRQNRPLPPPPPVAALDEGSFVVERPPTEAMENDPTRNRQQQQQQQDHHHPLSFFQRLLVLAGAIPMSPEEEAFALGNLVDMFPQYERSHLLRELRERGSAEAVVEAIMIGAFSSGVPRGGGGL